MPSSEVPAEDCKALWHQGCRGGVYVVTGAVAGGRPDAARIGSMPRLRPPCHFGNARVLALKRQALG